MDSSPDDTALHEELLAGGREEFPIESFLLMRRTGLNIEECLDALGYKVSDLSFQHRAIDSDQIGPLTSPPNCS